MVSLWPWKGDGLSPAEFEKTLSSLASKITTTQAELERVRNSSRRVKLLLTLYLTFAYLICAIVLTLVIGWRNLGPWEWTGMAGGPVLIYVLRTATNAYFSFRLDTLESRIKDRQAERAKTIQKLKDATKYDSTLELLEKYGGSNERRPRGDKSTDASESSPVQANDRSKKKHRLSMDSSHLAPRSLLGPPPTANIQRPSTALGIPPAHQNQFPSLRSPQTPPSHSQPTEEFAPNAGPLPPTYNQYEMAPAPPRWYDRILDLMLGDDETAPKNRIVLICGECRLVNGQAPPGVKNLAELGTWKCMGCGFTNREIDEGRKIMQEVFGNKKTARDGSGSSSPDERDSDQSSDVVKVEKEDAGNPLSAAATRHPTEEPRAKGRERTSQMVP
ncbi:hypothetical protein GGR50DRAFT_610748 [Xylaria sp. CBS 124048]|nr:hypothetical protein GGR50DRAFT_610748 [Xylaria sp. CBS 124048]